MYDLSRFSFSVTSSAYAGDTDETYEVRAAYPGARPELYSGNSLSYVSYCAASYVALALHLDIPVPAYPVPADEYDEDDYPAFATLHAQVHDALADAEQPVTLWPDND